MARTLGARVVMPDYLLAPEHIWRDSFGPLIHSYPLLPIAPEARSARRQSLEFFP